MARVRRTTHGKTDRKFTNHNNGESLQGADVSAHPKYRYEGIGSFMIEERQVGQIIRYKKERQPGEDYSYSYCEHADKKSPLEYANKVLEENNRPSSFVCANGFM